MSCLPRLADRRSQAAVDRVVMDQSSVQATVADELSRRGKYSTWALANEKPARAATPSTVNQSAWEITQPSAWWQEVHRIAKLRERLYARMSAHSDEDVRERFRRGRRKA
jgi:hypothetical protein